MAVENPTCSQAPLLTPWPSKCPGERLPILSETSPFPATTSSEGEPFAGVSSLCRPPDLNKKALSVRLCFPRQDLPRASWAERVAFGTPGSCGWGSSGHRRAEQEQERTLWTPSTIPYGVTVSHDSHAKCCGKTEVTVGRVMATLGAALRTSHSITPFLLLSLVHSLIHSGSIY